MSSAAPISDAPQRRDEGRRLVVVRRRSRRLIRRGRARRIAPAVLFCSIVAAALIFGILLERVVLSQSAFKLWDIRKSLAEEEVRHEELLLEAARLESPGRIERYARVQLGMVEPSSVEYIVADIPTRSDEQLAGLPRPGAPGPVAPASAQGVTP